MNEPEIRCPHCNQRKFASHPEHNYHQFDCPEQTKEQLLETVRKYNETAHRYAQRVHVMHGMVNLWQGKFHTLRLENNALRKQVAKGKMKAEPQWHNPESLFLSVEEKQEGWRFLRSDEQTIPPMTEFFDDATQKWVSFVEPSHYSGCFHKGYSKTWRTKTPLPTA